MLAEELEILDGISALWQPARPLLNAVLQLEQYDDTFSWHGWDKQQISTWLRQLASPSSLVVGVWETPESEAGSASDQLILGVVCEVVDGEVRSIRTFEALTSAGLKPVKALEPGYEDALEIMRIVRKEVAPVSWALFTDRACWNEWLFATAEDGGVIDKGELLATFAQQGRCVVLGGR